jgi:hypothetical protein
MPTKYPATLLVLLFLCSFSRSFLLKELHFVQQLPSTTLPHDTASVTKKPAPGSSVTPWTDEIPRSANVLVPRMTSTEGSIPLSTSLATTLGPSLASLVLMSTKLSTLPPGLCGFLPFWNGSATTLGKTTC